MASDDDRIWLTCLRRRPAAHRIAICTGIYFVDGRDRVPSMTRTEVEALILDFHDDLRLAGWVGPHAPGHGRRKDSASAQRT